MALFAEEDGYAVYRKIAEQAGDYLTKKKKNLSGNWLQARRWHQGVAGKKLPSKTNPSPERSIWQR